MSWGQGDSIAGRSLSLYMADLDSIPGVPYGHPDITRSDPWMQSKQ